MCGINGFSFHDPTLLRKMHALTRHRGPDDEGFYDSPEMSLAHNRLSIIDLSCAGHQPMKSSDGRYVIVFNGEIYNFPFLRNELVTQGVRFQSRSDTEVIIEGFACWGVAIFPKLRGIFALAIYDTQEQRLYLARDHVGVKPLYYHFDGTRLYFSSELKAIYASGKVARALDPVAFQSYFHFLYVPGEQTIVQGIKRLPPGSYASFQDHSFEIKRYWELKEGEPLSDYQEAKALVREGVLDAVRSQLISDRPLGVFLSGGVDSTLVLAAMRQTETGSLKTFTVGYASDVESEKYNRDAVLAKRTAAYFGTEHHEYILRPEDAAACLEKTIWHMDEPVSNHIQTSSYFLAEQAKPLITVALGGDGGDELFGGYKRYWLSSVMDRYQALPGSLRRAVVHVAGLFCERERLQRLEVPQGVERWCAFLGQKEAVIASFLHSASVTKNQRDTLSSLFGSPWRDRTNQFMAMDLKTWIPNESLIRSDRMTMAHGLEQRVPLLDVALLELSTRIPSSWKLGARDQGKRILKEAFSDLLPSHVLHQEKRGWFSPMSKWLRGPLLPLAKEILSPSYCEASANFFDFSAIDRILEGHLSGKAYALDTLWSLITFQMWMKGIFLS
ncbi:MAG: asparagine synthase (glutamine-hydrolyzing) [bacterium]|nr:asparagine synthase (glutamine-hydrolyzing) [bacterium]